MTDQPTDERDLFLAEIEAMSDDGVLPWDVFEHPRFRALVNRYGWMDCLGWLHLQRIRSWRELQRQDRITLFFEDVFEWTYDGSGEYLESGPALEKLGTEALNILLVAHRLVRRDDGGFDLAEDSPETG